MAFGTHPAFKILSHNPNVVVGRRQTFITPAYNTCSGSLNPMSFYRVWSFHPSAPILVSPVYPTVSPRVLTTRATGSRTRHRSYVSPIGRRMLHRVNASNCSEDLIPTSDDGRLLLSLIYLGFGGVMGNVEKAQVVFSL